MPFSFAPVIAFQSRSYSCNPGTSAVVAVIKHGDVLLGFVTCLIASPMHPFLLQSAEETFELDIVPTISLSTHTAQDSMGFHQSPECLAGIQRPPS